MPLFESELGKIVEAKRADEKSDVLLRDEFQPWRPAVLGMQAEMPFELLSDLARHFVKLAYCADMAKAYGEIFWEGQDTVDYLGLLTGPDGTEPRDFAARCLNTILLFRPDDFYANYLLGTILRDQGSYQEAIKHFRAAAVYEGFSYHAWWEAAVLLDELGRDTEAIEAYRLATRNNQNPRGVEISRFADCLRRNGHIAEAMDVYDRALDYDYGHLKELMHPESWAHDPDRPAGLVIPWTPDPETSEAPQLVRESDSRIRSLLGRRGDVYRWRDQYFAAPRMITKLTANDLTYAALWRDSWIGLIDGFLEQFPFLYRLFGFAIHLILPGAERRFLRRRIRAADTIEDLLEGRNLRGLVPSSGTFRDARGIPYRIYCFEARYYAVPAHMREVDRNDISFIGPMLLGWRGYVERLIESTPILYVSFHAILRKKMPGIIRRFERRRIRSARTVDRLVGLITSSRR